MRRSTFGLDGGVLVERILRIRCTRSASRASCRGPGADDERRRIVLDRSRCARDRPRFHATGARRLLVHVRRGAVREALRFCIAAGTARWIARAPELRTASAFGSGDLRSVSRLALRYARYTRRTSRARRARRGFDRDLPVRADAASSGERPNLLDLDPDAAARRARASSPIAAESRRIAAVRSCAGCGSARPRRSRR